MLIGLGTQHAKDELREFIEAAKFQLFTHYLQKQFYLMIILIVLVT